MALATCDVAIQDRGVVHSKIRILNPQKKILGFFQIFSNFLDFFLDFSGFFSDFFPIFLGARGFYEKKGFKH